MPRQARDENLATRTARLKRSPRAEPYFRTIQPGRAIGYRRLGGDKGGMWIARAYDAARGRKYLSIGPADDFLDADGVSSLSFAQAQEKARAWFEIAFLDPLAQAAGAPKTVADAVAHYLDDYSARGGKAAPSLRNTIDAHILPSLASYFLPPSPPRRSSAGTPRWRRLRRVDVRRRKAQRTPHLRSRSNPLGPRSRYQAKRQRSSRPTIQTRRGHAAPAQTGCSRCSRPPSTSRSVTGMSRPTSLGGGCRPLRVSTLRASASSTIPSRSA